LAVNRKLQHSKLQKLQVNTMKRMTGKRKKNKKNGYITDVLVQHSSLQLVNTRHQINFAVQMMACTG